MRNHGRAYGSQESWCVGSLIAALRAMRHLPLVMIHAGDHVIRQCAHDPSTNVRCMGPTSNPSEWLRVIAWCWSITCSQGTKELDDDLQRRGSAEQAYLIDAGSGIRIDLGRCHIIKNGRITRLTGREVRILRVLVASPARFHSAAELARRVAQSPLDVLDEHCIEQAICKLRGKLGENARDARVIVSRPGLGYALFTGPAPSPAASVGSPVMSCVECGSSPHQARTPQHE